VGIVPICDVSTVPSHVYFLSTTHLWLILRKVILRLYVVVILTELKKIMIVLKPVIVTGDLKKYFCFYQTVKESNKLLFTQIFKDL